MFEKETLRISVGGMTCNNCVRHVTKALESVSGVKRAEVDLSAGRAEVTAKPGTGIAALVAAVREAGYEAHVAEESA